jgi:hypothetical protein
MQGGDFLAVFNSVPEFIDYNENRMNNIASKYSIDNSVIPVAYGDYNYSGYTTPEGLDVTYSHGSVNYDLVSEKEINTYSLKETITSLNLDIKSVSGQIIKNKSLNTNLTEMLNYMSALTVVQLG